MTTRVSTIEDTFKNNGESFFWNWKEWNTTPSTIEHAVVGDRELIPNIPDAVVTEEENPFWGMDRMIDYFHRLAGRYIHFYFIIMRKAALKFSKCFNATDYSAITQTNYNYMVCPLDQIIQSSGFWSTSLGSWDSNYYMNSNADNRFWLTVF